MKTYISSKTCLFFFVLCISVAVHAQKTKTLTILHTNDLHSRIEAIDPDSPDTLTAGKGGLLRVAAYVTQMRKENPDVLVFDCGDFSQGTPYYNLFRGEVEVSLMNAIGYTAGTIGNHEFDSGMENMERLFKLAAYPIVSTNYDFTHTMLDGLVKPYIILKKNGLKIGVFGLGTDPKGMIQRSNYEGMVYLDPFETANKTAALLKKKGCDVVICLSHLGMYPSANNQTCDVNLAKNSRNIDLILGGHSHTLLKEVEVYRDLDNKEVYISQVGKSGTYVGRIDLIFKK